MKELKNLYNGIMNDYSIRKFTLGWKDVTEKIEKRYKSIPKSNIDFTNKLVSDALLVTRGSLHNAIQSFAKEMSINSETLQKKY